ncbi:MAG: Holliday junction branch migration DNA helicase RuvB, partial [Desulfobacteraceae bacterium]|nr:Holliday junction branch migration DNA helicase RuvB [Desulfobacteraceae bacterium]
MSNILSYSSDKPEIVSRAELAEDQKPEMLSLRPERLSEYIGQAEVVETLKIAIEAAKKREEPLDTFMFHGPPGLGKTTLAHIMPMKWR